MSASKNIHASYKFTFSSDWEHKNCLKIKNHYTFGEKAVLVSGEVFKTLSEEEKGKFRYNTNSSSIGNNFRGGYFTLQNIQTILCWMFYKKPDPTHSIEDVISFLDALSIHEDEVSNTFEIARVFREFMETQESFFSESFKDYTFSFNASTMKFEIQKSSDGKHTPDDTSKGNSKGNNVPPKEDKPTPWYKKVRVWLVAGLILLILLSVGAVGIIFFSHDPIFEADNPYYKILILPFENDCPNESSLEKADTNAVLQRLLALNKRDSLGLDVRYFKGFDEERTKDERYQEDFYKRIMQKENADHIIYGSVLPADCSDSGEDKLALSYQIDERTYSVVELDNFATVNKFALLPSAVSFEDILKGKQLEDLEYAVYINIALSLMEQNRFGKADYYLSQLLKNEHFSNEYLYYVSVLRYELYGKYITNHDGFDPIKNVEKINDNVIYYCNNIKKYSDDSYSLLDVEFLCSLASDFSEDKKISLELRDTIDQALLDDSEDPLYNYLKAVVIISDLYSRWEDYQPDQQEEQMFNEVFYHMDKVIDHYDELGFYALKATILVFDELELTINQKITDYVDMALDRKPNDFDILITKVEHSRHLGKLDKALMELELVYEKHPDSLYVLEDLAGLSLSVGESKKAYNFYTKYYTDYCRENFPICFWSLEFLIKDDIQPFIDKEEYGLARKLITQILDIPGFSFEERIKLVKLRQDLNYRMNDYKGIIHDEAKLFELNLMLHGKIYGPENNPIDPSGMEEITGSYYIENSEN